MHPPLIGHKNENYRNHGVTALLEQVAPRSDYLPRSRGFPVIEGDRISRWPFIAHYRMIHYHASVRGVAAM